MSETKKSKDKPRYSWRWKVILILGALAILATLLKFGFWASAGVAFVVFLVLAYGKPYVRYRKLVYRGVMIAGGLVLGASFALDTVLRELIPNSVTRLFFAFALGFPIGVIPVALLIEIYGLIRLHWVTAISTEIDTSTALAFLRNLFLGLNYPVMVVENGRVQTTREGGPGGFLQRVGGPGLIVINHGNAVVLERNGKFTKVAKSGIAKLEMYERPRAIVDLRQQKRRWRVEEALTLDGISTCFDLTIWYQIRHSGDRSRVPTAEENTGRKETKESQLSVNASGSKTAETLGNPDLVEIAMSEGVGKGGSPKDCYEVREQDVINAVYNIDDWQQAVEAMAEHVLRDVVAERELDRICAYDFKQGRPTPRYFIRVLVRRRLNQFLERERWGVEVVWVDIGSIVLPEAVRNRMQDKWLAEWEGKVEDLKKRATILRGEAEASAVSAQENARAQASMQMITTILQALQDAQGLPDSPDIADVIEIRMIQALERITEHANGVFLPSDLLEMLGTRGRLQAAPRIIGAPDDEDK